VGIVGQGVRQADYELHRGLSFDDGTSIELA
jgi:hypothetical protein